MDDSQSKFSTPLNVPRPRGTRLLTAFSPKLDRTIRAFDYPGLEQWIRLEADPTVTSFCEHPARLGANDTGRLVDFWVDRSGREEMLILARGEAAGAAIPPAVEGIKVRLVPTAELAAAKTWIENWLRMIPTINATRKLLTQALLNSAVRAVREPVAMALVEHELSMGDPSVVRGAIFELLRAGRLKAPSLHTQALSLHTIVEPAQ